jgi:spermidine synthase
MRALFPVSDARLLPLVWLLAIGVVSILGQVVLLRELNVAFFGSELIYILALGVWMFWTAIGAAAGRRRSLPSAGRVRGWLVVLACALPLALVFARGLRVFFGGVPGAYLPFPRQLLAMAMALLPVSVVLGLLFQWAAKQHVEEREGTLAGAYAVESVGGLLGGILATLLLKWGVQNLDAGLLCASLAAAAAVPRRRGDRRTVPAAAAALSVALAMLAVYGGTAIDRRLTGWNHPSLVDTRDSPYGRVTVTAAEGQVSVFENDALIFDSEGTAAEEFAHLAAIQHPAPRSVLILGGGIEGVVAEVLRHRPEHVDYVELNEILLELLSPRLPERIRDSLEAREVNVSVADPRRFLENAGKYDLILIGMPEPSSGQANRFYTRELFTLCSEHLAPGGVLALRLRGAENLWTPQLTLRAASIHGALRAVFADVVVLPGTTNVMLASNEPLSRDPRALGNRLRDRGIEARLVIPAYVEYLYTNDRFFDIERRLDEADAPVNTDVRPVCYTSTMMLWLSMFYPDLGLVELPFFNASSMARTPVPWIVLAGAGVVMLLVRRRPMPRSAMLAATAGFVGMVLETALILHYQTVRGVLFQDLGLLLTMFMAGLALGAAATDRLAVRRSPSRLPGVVMVLAFAVLNLLVAWWVSTAARIDLFGTSFLLLACGFLVAALFAWAGLQRRVDQRTIISPLYAADLVGGSLGSLVACLILIPLGGLAASTALMALVALAALLLV